MCRLFTNSPIEGVLIETLWSRCVRGHHILEASEYLTEIDLCKTLKHRSEFQEVGSEICYDVN